ncbi:MAG: ATP-binding protein [Thermodesulfobacteriota bacterium]|nr:ATP-binding protein [Thermodesulfobacteriota bacterium]
MNTGLTLSEAIPYITRHTDSGLTGRTWSILWLSGPPGIGKSDLMRQFCRQKGYGLKVVYMATLMLEQITGLPMVQDAGNGKQVHWSCPEIFNFDVLEIAPADSKVPIILFLDDAHLCNRQIQAYLFQLLTYRTIHDHRLPERVAMVLAGNRSTDRADFHEILAPVANRIFFVDMRPDVDQWIRDFALQRGLRQDVITFLQHYPEYFLGTPMESRAWSSPRSWTYASHTFDACGEELDDKTLFVILSGHVGSDAATKFIEYHQLFAKWDAHRILLEGNTPDMEQLNKIQAYALLSACVAYLLRRLRAVNFQTNPELDQAMSALAALIMAMSTYHREIVPLGLKTLLLAENQATGTTTMVRRLLTEADAVVAELLTVT